MQNKEYTILVFKTLVTNPNITFNTFIYLLDDIFSDPSFIEHAFTNCVIDCWILEDISMFAIIPDTIVNLIKDCKTAPEVLKNYLKNKKINFTKYIFPVLRTRFPNLY